MSAEGVRLIEPTFLFNVLNKETNYPCLSDPVYLLLLDAREEVDYNEGHLITSKLVRKNSSGEFVVPYSADLECKTHVVVYDGCTDFVNEDTPAIACARKMWQMGSRNTVQVLKGGYELFSAVYPFLRTTKIIYMPRELDELQTYPTEILPSSLYLGNWTHGTCAYIQKDLKIKAHIICELNVGTFCIDELKEGQELLHLQIEDDDNVDLLPHLKTACDFLDRIIQSRKAVLVFSLHGISRSVAIIIAYLVYLEKITVEAAYKLVRSYRPTACPNQSFLRQLTEWSTQYVIKKQPSQELSEWHSQDPSVVIEGVESRPDVNLTEDLEEMSVRVNDVAEYGPEEEWKNWVGVGERDWEWDQVEDDEDGREEEPQTNDVKFLEPAEKVVRVASSAVVIS